MYITVKRKTKLILQAGILIVIALIMLIVFVPRSHSSAAETTRFTTVVVDAGHGGFDGGATGYNGLIEKDINLAIAKDLQCILKACGFDVVMTRQTDEALCSGDLSDVPAVSMKKTDMRKRLQIMDETPNSLTVSIHQNKFEQRSSKGAQMFFGVVNPLSEQLAECIQSQFIDKLQNSNTRKIKKAQKDLFLLYYTKAPAVIVECGFISNPDEAARLSDAEYQKRVALTVFAGITEFIKNQGSNLNGSKN